MEKLKWDEHLRWLNRLLAGYVYRADAIRQLAKKLGYPVIKLKLDNDANNIWFQVLDYYIQNFEADQAKAKINAYIEEIIEVEGELPELILAKNWQSPKSKEKELDAKEYDTNVPEKVEYEKLMKKKSTLLPLHFLEVGLQRAKAVGRIETETQWGTGFLLKDNYVLTNQHVIPDVATAKTSEIQFNYQRDAEGKELKTQPFTFDAEVAGHFATSESADDDWTILKLKGDANSKFGHIEIGNATIKNDERVSIIQHPGGRHKEIGLHNNFVTYNDENTIMYLTDTLPGSSGSPVFNNKWQLIGLHNRGGHLREPNTDLVVWRNGGTNINKVLKGIRDANIGAF